MTTYEIRIQLVIKDDKESLLKKYDKMRDIIEQFMSEQGVQIDISEPQAVDQEIPPYVTQWFLSKKSGFGRDLTLILLYLHDPNPLTKSELESKAEKVGVSIGEYEKWLDKTFMSAHGGVKGLVIPIQNKVRSYKLSPLGRDESRKLVQQMKSAYNN